MSSGPNTPTFPPNPTPFGFGFTNIDEKIELGISSNVESGKDEIEDEIEDFTPSEGRPTSISECREIERLYDAVNVILSYQNANGGFATYELTRSYQWLELINPVETFGDLVIDYSYVECTSAAVQALDLFFKKNPGHRRDEIENCIAKAADFIEKLQAKDGSWYRSWGVCFTYGGWLGIKGLIAAGKTYKNCSSIRKGSRYLLSKELSMCGWGESYLSCQNKVPKSF